MSSVLHLSAVAASLHMHFYIHNPLFPCNSATRRKETEMLQHLVKAREQEGAGPDGQHARARRDEDISNRSSGLEVGFSLHTGCWRRYVDGDVVLCRSTFISVQFEDKPRDPRSVSGNHESMQVHRHVVSLRWIVKTCFLDMIFSLLPSQ